MKRYNFTLLEKQKHLLKILLFASGLLLGPSPFFFFSHIFSHFFSYNYTLAFHFQTHNRIVCLLRVSFLYVSFSSHSLFSLFSFIAIGFQLPFAYHVLWLVYVSWLGSVWDLSFDFQSIVIWYQSHLEPILARVCLAYQATRYRIVIGSPIIYSFTHELIGSRCEGGWRSHID